jgi:hypothetical protein
MPSYKVHIVFGVGHGIKNSNDVIYTSPSHKSLRSIEVGVLFDYVSFNLYIRNLILKIKNFHHHGGWSNYS